MLKKYVALLFLLLGCALCSPAADTSGASPIIVGGNFSVQSNVAANTRGFTQQARDAEVASLRDKINAGQYKEVILRINHLISNNFLDDRFYLLEAIAFDHLGDDDSVIYTASQAISVAPQDPRAYLLRAGARLKKQDWENARMDIDAALKLNPQSQLAKQYQKELKEKQPFKREGAVPTAKELAKQRTTPTWLTLYFVIVVVAILLFLYWRYEDLLHQPKNAFARKEVEIKEQYDFIRQIGEGGMGKVYEAYDRVLKRRVAIKRAPSWCAMPTSASSSCPRRAWWPFCATRALWKFTPLLSRKVRSTWCLNMWTGNPWKRAWILTGGYLSPRRNKFSATSARACNTPTRRTLSTAI